MTGKYPHRIGRALGYLDAGKIREFSPLTRPALAALRALITFIDNKDVRKPVYATRETLGQRVRYSSRSIEAGVKELVEMGLIERLAQKRRQTGETWAWSVRPLKLTEKCIVALSLELAQFSSADTPAKNAEQVKSSFQSQKQQDSQQHAHVPFAKIGNVSIPADLVVLTRHGILPTVVLMLMKLAKQNGKRLSDIVQTRGAALLKFDGRRLFGYLRHLILAQDFDPTWQAMEAEKTEEAARVRKEAEMIEAAMLNDMRGKTFDIGDSLATVAYEGGRWLVTVTDKQSGRSRVGLPSTEVLARIKAGCVAVGTVQPGNAVHAPQRSTRRSQIDAVRRAMMGCATAT